MTGFPGGNPSLHFCFLAASVLGFVDATALPAQTTISGHVRDAVTHERLIGASVYVPALRLGVATDADGYFLLQTDGDAAEVEFSYTGYVLAKAAYRDHAYGLLIDLEPGATLQTAEVTAARRADEIDDRVGMSTVDIPLSTYKTAPVLLGEPDILKILQLMPGVSGGAEGTAGLYVRGGSPDQNLILLDGVPLYNVSHALGIFSVFNADAVQDVRLTKGGFPARFGGRLSSVLEVETKDGPADAWRAEGAVGLVASRLTVGGPVGERTRVLASARRTYFDALYRPILALRDQDSPVSEIFRANFYDANLKVRHDLSERHRLFATAYFGGDRFGFGDVLEQPGRYTRYEEGATWGNRVAALRWRAQLGPRAYLNTVASYSRYGIGYSLENESRTGALDDATREDYVSSVRDFNLEADLAYAPSARHTFRAGAIATRHRYSPGELRTRASFGGETRDTSYAQARLDATEAAAYVEHEWTVTDALALDYGLHASAFRSDATYASLQPRLAARYRLPARYALKASYARMTQYVNLLTTESLSLPTDVWVPSASDVRPQQSWQTALGLVGQPRPDLELSAEAFYKSLDGVVSYRAGESFFEFDPARSWRDKITQGTGRVYGLELLAQRKFGRTNGWVGYTYSRNDRRFAALNNGRAFPFRYDRRHDASVVVTHEISERLTVSGSWIYASGNAYTLPEYRQYTGIETDGVGVYRRYRIAATPQAGSRNGFRVSDTHRLDVSATLTKSKRWGERAWVLGVYNAYWRRNPVYVRVKDVLNATTGEVDRQFQEVSLLPIVPSVAYQFRFAP